MFMKIINKNSRVFLATVCSQRILPGIEERQFSELCDSVSSTDKTQLLSVSSTHASAWLSAVEVNLSIL